MASGRPWTSEELTIAKAMRRKRNTYQFIADRLNRTIGQVHSKLTERPRHVLKNPVAAEIMRETASTLPPPTEVLFDRDRRLGAPRTIYMTMFGDPLPGQSMLDRSKRLCA